MSKSAAGRLVSTENSGTSAALMAASMSVHGA
jgi:hypothetical protein